MYMYYLSDYFHMHVNVWYFVYFVEVRKEKDTLLSEVDKVVKQIKDALDQVHVHVQVVVTL